MHKCTPIDRNQVNLTKIIDGWQGIKVDFSRFNQLLQKVHLCTIVKLRKWNSRCYLVAPEFNIR